MYRNTLAAVAVLTALSAPAVHAQDSRAMFDRLWSNATLYKGGEDAFVNSVQLSGRFQVDQAHIDSSYGDLSQLNLRRMRVGVKTKFRDDFTVHVEADYDPNGGNLNYLRLTDAYFGWAPSDAFGLKVGKHGAEFTLDGMTSSKELVTIDRSNLANNIWFTEEYVPGISIEGERGKLVYQGGVYSSGSRDRGFGDSDGGEFVLATVGYAFGEQLGADEALLRLNLLDNEPNAANGFTRPLEQVASLTFVYARGAWRVGSDYSEAKGYFSQSDLTGASVMPSYELSDAVELVGRYTYVSSDAPNGVRLGRYENEVVAGRGDHYREIYAGANYYWNGHKLKLQTGLQYATMADTAADGGRYRGLSLTTGVRLSW